MLSDYNIQKESALHLGVFDQYFSKITLTVLLISMSTSTFPIFIPPDPPLLFALAHAVESNLILYLHKYHYNIAAIYYLPRDFDPQLPRVI